MLVGEGGIRTQQSLNTMKFNVYFQVFRTNLAQRSDPNE